MKLFGFDITRHQKRIMTPPTGNWSTIFDYNTGAWQQDSSITLDTVLTFGAVFACIRLIASDIGKMRLRLMGRETGGIFQETESPAFSPVLRRPNSTQTRIKFIEYWLQSKMQFGNTYVLKTRDGRRQVVALRVLAPDRVQPLVSDAGEVFYKLRADNLARIRDDVVVPATEIIHDVHMTPEHPLVGVSPIGACGLAATQGIKIQTNSKNHFSNMSRPSGILTAEGHISDETATRLKAAWNTNYGSDNFGKTAVLGDGLQFSSVATNAVDAQLIEQLNWTAEDVCRAFGVPAYKVGVGPMPAFNNIEALDQAYYSQTLQELIECIEALLDDGLELPARYRTEFDLSSLLRMDTLTQAKVHAEEIKAGYLAPNEARAQRGYLPVKGGETPYLQQQNYSLAALAKRDASADPFATAPPPAPPPDEPPDVAPDVAEASLRNIIRKVAA